MTSASSSISRTEWLKLYKELQRAVTKFPQYSYRHFGRRRIRDYFEHYRMHDTSTTEIARLFNEGQENLESIRRQTLVSSQFPNRPLVIEVFDKNKLSTTKTEK